LIVLHIAFQKQSSHNEPAIYTGYVVAETTAERQTPFQDSTSEALLLVAAEAEFLSTTQFMK
jgi:hypothetical protein